MPGSALASGRPAIQGAKGAFKAVRQRFRWATAGARPFPDVIIVGAQRAGTTSLLRYLDQHPQVRRSLKKEVHYFDVNHHRGERWYRGHFPRVPAGAGLCVLESSPYYLFHPRAPERIARLLPDVKLIALLRDPVERALSHYFHEVRRGREELAPLEAFRAEAGRLAGEEEKLWADDRYVSRPHRRFSYQARGVYAPQLRRFEPWLRSGQLRVVQSEELYAQPAAVLADLFGFLGVDAAFRCPDLRPRNVGGNREAVASEVTEHLTRFFEPHNADLEDFLGRSFDWPEPAARLGRAREGAR